MKSKVVMTGLAMVVLGTGFFTVTQAEAVENPQDTLVSKIATKFNLNKADVQAVFDEHRSEMQGMMQTKYQEYLDTLVKEGKITEAQKTLLLNKHKELASQFEANKDELRNLTPEDRKTKMEAKRTELYTWAKENGIDPQYLSGPMGRVFGGHGGHGHFQQRVN